MNRDAWDILVARYLDGSATDAEVEQLDGQLTANPDAAGLLLDAARYDALLRDALAEVDAPAADARTASVESYRLPVANWRWSRWVGIAACLVIAVSVAWRVVLTRHGTNVAVAPAPGGPPAAARVIATGPGVTIASSAGARTAGAETGLAVADRIRTNAGASATIAYDNEDTRLTLGSATSIALADAANGKRFELSAGTLDCRVDKQLPGRPLIVMTPQAQVLVVGTRFRLNVLDRWTRLAVSEGTVRVTRLGDGATVDVSAGEFVDVPAAAVASQRPPALARPAGRDMADFWSVEVGPAGISQ